MGKYKVYTHRRKDNLEVFYVGKGLKYRPYDLTLRSEEWKHIHSKTDIFIEIVAEFDDEYTALELETFLILEYGRIVKGDGPLVNKLYGAGDIWNRGIPHTKEHRKKLKIARNKRGPFSMETRMKISLANRGSKHHNYGKTASKETRELQSKAKRKMVLDRDTGIVYSCGKEVAEIFNINRNTLRAKLNGTLENNTRFEYYL